MVEQLKRNGGDHRILSRAKERKNFLFLLPSHYHPHSHPGCLALMSLHSVGILTISDTAHKDPASDTAGPLLRSSLESHPSDGFRVVVHAIVPDEPGIIQSTVRKWIDQTGVTLCITTGGTGFGIRDSTREALEPLINKPTPALSHALTSYSLTKTPFAALSRPLTGIRTKGHGTAGSLIVTLPGSKKAVKECLEVLIGDGNSQGILLHALDLISGGSGKGVHRDLQGSSEARDSKTEVSTNADTGKAHTHSHHHHHHSSHGHGHGHHAPKPRTQGYLTLDPNSPNSQRHRQSPYPIIPLTEALDLIVKNTPSPNESTSFKPISLPIDSSLVSHVLAEDVRAIKDLPSGPTTNVDGYAVSAAQTPIGEYQVVTATTLAQRVSSGEQAEIKKGEVFRINTGQGLPVGTDSVVMVEDTLLIEENKSEGLAKCEELRIKVLAQVDKGENVRPEGSDVREGDVVLTKGSNISSLGGEIGTLAFVGRTEVLVHRKPKIAILSTGNELVDINSSESSSFKDDTWGFSVFDSNRPGLTAAIKGQGYDVLDLGIVGDDIEATLKVLRKGLDESDMIITTGGTSMGESDLLKPLIERELKGTIHFGRVAMKPGKPTTFATVDHPSPAPASSSNTAVSSKFIFALPGNPASALVCFHVFVLPCLRKLSGHSSSENGFSNPKIKVTLSSRMNLDQRPEFHRVVVKVKDGKLIAFSTGSQRSSGMHSMATSNALICLSSSDNSDKKALEAGDEADAVILGPIL